MKKNRLALMALLCLCSSTIKAQIPILSSSTNGSLCQGSTSTLSIDLTDEAYYPAIPNDHNLKHYTYSWFRDGNQVNAVTRAYDADQPGLYKAVVQEFPQIQVNGDWQWADAPDITASTNTLQLDFNSGSIVKAGFSINGTALSSLQPAQLFNPFFNCAQLMFADASAGAVKSYKLEITDATFNTVLYSTGDVFAQPVEQLDLHNLCQAAGESIGNCRVLGDAEVSGAFGIRYTVTDGCVLSGNISTCYSLVYVSAAPGGNTVAFKTMSIHDANGATWYNAANSTVAAPDQVGRRSTVFNFSGVSYRPSPAICSYDLELYQWNGSNWGTVVWTQNVLSDCTTGNIIHAPIDVIGGTDFFGDPLNAPEGSIWKIVCTLHNTCGSYSESEIFRISENNFE